MLPSAVLALLPTPTASDANGPGLHGTGAPDLRTTISLLPTPTPTARDGKGPNQRNDATCLHGALLPTPQARDGDSRGASHPDRRKELQPKRAGQLDEVAVHLLGPLLPTPKASDGKRNDSPGEQARTSPALGAVVPQNSSVDWGAYAWAIARWEQTFGAEAPSPTVLSRRGKPVLNPVFVEWLMGVDAGWVTDVPDLSRPQLLRILGNGVVPAQGAAAFRYLLAHLSAAAAA